MVFSMLISVVLVLNLDVVVVPFAESPVVVAMLLDVLVALPVAVVVVVVPLPPLLCVLSLLLASLLDVVVE